MKKTLLTLAAVTITTLMSSANDYTFTFDGENDMYGLTRQTSNNAATLEFVDSWEFSESGINFSLKKTSESDERYGYALVNAGGTKGEAGIYVSSNGNNELTLTVPGGHITEAKLFMSGYALAALDLTFNDIEISAENEGIQFYWEWSDAEGGETLTITWPFTYGARYIHSLELTYTPDLGSKQDCGLSFSNTKAEAIMGESFTPPVLSNPNNLPITWNSSNENVATVNEEGQLTLIAGGKTSITVSTEGNDSFAPGNAKYELSVVPSAKSLVQMLEVAPDVNSRVYVNFPCTVTYASGSNAYVLDPEGNAGQIQDIRNQGSTSTSSITIYKVGNVIPAGWIATNATIYGSILWQGLPDKVEETVEVEYPEVQAITPADANRVVTLMNVTFTSSTPDDNGKTTGTTPDGNQYEFQNPFGIDVYKAATYDVTGVVKYSEHGETVYFYMAPISYTESKDSGVNLITSSQSVPRYYTMQGVEVTNPQKGIYIMVTDGEASKVVIK